MTVHKKVCWGCRRERKAFEDFIFLDIFKNYVLRKLNPCQSKTECMCETRSKTTLTTSNERCSTNIRTLETDVQSTLSSRNVTIRGNFFYPPQNRCAFRTALSNRHRIFGTCRRDVCRTSLHSPNLTVCVSGNWGAVRHLEKNIRQENAFSKELFEVKTATFQHISLKYHKYSCILQLKNIR